MALAEGHVMPVITSVFDKLPMSLIIEMVDYTNAELAEVHLLSGRWFSTVGASMRRSSLTSLRA